MICDRCREEIEPDETKERASLYSQRKELEVVKQRLLRLNHTYVTGNMDVKHDLYEILNTHFLFEKRRLNKRLKKAGIVSMT